MSSLDGSKSYLFENGRPLEELLYENGRKNKMTRKEWPVHGQTIWPKFDHKSSHWSTSQMNDQSKFWLVETNQTKG